MTMIRQQRQFRLVDQLNHGRCESFLGVEKVGINVLDVDQQMLSGGQMHVSVIVSRGHLVGCVILEAVAVRRTRPIEMDGLTRQGAALLIGPRCIRGRRHLLAPEDHGRGEEAGPCDGVAVRNDTRSTRGTPPRVAHEDGAGHDADDEGECRDGHERNDDERDRYRDDERPLKHPPNVVGDVD